MLIKIGSLRSVMLTGLVLQLAGCASVSTLPDNLPRPVKEYLTPIDLNAKQQTGIEQYNSYQPVKAFAVSRTGNYGYGYLGDSKSGSARSALYWCQHYSPQPCRVQLINQELFQPAYAEYARRSALAIAGLKVPNNQDYNLEGMDWGIPSPTRLRQQNTERYDQRTPLSLTGIRTIKTAEVAQMLVTSKPILIDAQGWEEDRPNTIPGALVVDWAGTEEAHLPGREEKMLKDFATVMQLIEPDKTKPVVVFCHSAICWLSINTALRLQAIGYTNVYWYRGGKESWISANLPLIPSVPHATIWSPR